MCGKVFGWFRRWAAIYTYIYPYSIFTLETLRNSQFSLWDCNKNIKKIGLRGSVVRFVLKYVTGLRLAQNVIK